MMPMRKPDAELKLVQTSLPDPPYDRKTRSKGMHFDIDVERLVQSKTWLLASDDMKPWLLRLWVESWRSIPVGSFENDDELISARIGMLFKAFQINRKILLRGWVLHSDDRLYHPTISELVLALVGWRNKEKNRKKAWRESEANKNNDIQDMSHGTDGDRQLLTSADDTSSSSSYSSSSSLKDANASRSKPSVSTAQKNIVPYQKILELYHETLPMLPKVRMLTDNRKNQIRLRWQNQFPNLETWAGYFEDIKRSKFLIGQGDPVNGRRAWQADIDWLLKPGNIAKVSEGKYHG